MTFALYLLQATVVFLCPVFFGWVLLRRIVRENDWLTILPGSFVIGSVALMALMNELRYWLEMPIAAWFAYKLLLAAGLIILVLTRKPRFALRLAGGSKRKLWAVMALAGTAVTGLFFGIPAAHGFLNDSWWFHYPAATLVQDLKAFPIPGIFAPDDPLYYHFGPDILAATWAYLLDTSVQTGFFASVCIFAPCTFLLGYALMLRSSRSHVGALAAAAFVVVGGNVLFLRLLKGGSLVGLQVLEKLNSGSVDGLLKLMFTPSHACGVPAVLVGVLLLWRFTALPSWSLAAVLGLWLGSLTLIAEWYFFLFFGALTLCFAGKILYDAFRARAISPPTGGFALRAAPLLIALGFGFFNNTYLSGIFGHFWMHYSSAELMAHARLEQSRLDEQGRSAAADRAYAHLIRGLSSSSQVANISRPSRKQPSRREPRIVGETPYDWGDDGPIQIEPWKPPALVPLAFNVHHLGLVPSWQGAGSSGASYVPILSFRFFAECTPVVLLGLPFGAWLALRRKHPIIRSLFVMALLGMLPPILLDWGFRSTDFLRFFTGAFSFSALLLGSLVGHLWSLGRTVPRIAASIICACALLNPLIVGFLGLRKSTFDAVQKVNQSAGSLKLAASEVEPTEGFSAGGNQQKSGTISSMASSEQSEQLAARRQLPSAQRREIAFNNLAEAARRYLYPLTLGRDRAIVIVPRDQTPPTETFPEWLKLATLSHLQLPIGWYWNDSFYAANYREAVTTLSPSSVAALDVRWVLVSNLFAAPPVLVMDALNDSQRFMIAQSFVNGPYNLIIYRVLPSGIQAQNDKDE